MTRGRLAAAGALVLALAASAARAAAPQEGWAPLVVEDAVADATARGAQFRSGSDLLVLFCRQDSGAKHFIARWVTRYKLGRGGNRGVIYRFDQQRPIAEDWFYTSRNVEGLTPTLWVDPSRRFARRILESGASQMLFRIRSRDGDIHDIAVPIDDTARALIRPALDACS